ncbi:MAG TPA: hypothetical protein VGF26_20905, partial [Ramlibacter sp.]
MDRRAVIGWLGAALLGGCGGGGGGGPSPIADGAGSAPVASNVALSSSIAMWGDSLTWGVADQLKALSG